MGIVIDLVGQVFSRLTVLNFVGLTQGKGSRRAIWLCQCVCGVSCKRQSDSLRSGKVKSCGCLWREKSRERTILRTARYKGVGNPRYIHGQRRTSTYAAWANMMTRATNPRANRAYKDVGVDARWRDFNFFRADMGDRPSPRHSLSRYLDSGDYRPGNVEWGTKADQTAEQYGKKAMQLLHAYHQGFEAGQKAFGRV